MWQRFFCFILDQLYPQECVSCSAPGSAMCVECEQSVSVQPKEQMVGNLRVESSYSYDEAALSAAVQAWKYEGMTDAIKPFIEKARFLDLQADLVLAVPLHRRRRLERGFNQAEVLAQHVAGQIGVAVSHGLKRVRYTPPQAKQDGEERRKNVKDAFVWKGEGLAGKQVLLVDDVVTTGATLSACAEALYAAGAREVRSWCLCRSK